MLTHVPIPTWRALGQTLSHALAGRSVSDVELGAPWCRAEEDVGWLSRSAWSLALIADWRRRVTVEESVTVWVPDYFCNGALEPLRRTGARIAFYRLGEGHTPDINACRALVESMPPHVVVLVHYFGEPAPAAAMKDLCARAGAWLVEDAAHVLRPAPGIGASGDFVLYSPHKHLAIPDGAVLVARPRGPSQLDAARRASFGPPDTWARQARDIARGVRIGGLSDGASIKWLSKRVAQMLGLRRWTRGDTSFAEPNAAPADDRLGPPELSALARRLLSVLIGSLPDTARRRQRNQLLWDHVIANARRVGAETRPASRPVCRNWTPYLTAFTIDSDAGTKLFAEWQRNGLPVTTWPDMPPEVAENRAKHDWAWQRRHSRVFLPVHQSVRAKDIVRVQDSDEAVPLQRRMTLQWNRVSRHEWAEWMCQVGRSNLLQTWAYGDAKAAGGWRTHRVVMLRDEQPVGIVQVLERRIGGVLRVLRISRGPLFFRELTAPEHRAAWNELAKLGSWRRGRLLSIAPEMPLSGESLARLHSLSFRERSPFAWESVWINLAIDADAIRRQLDGKWRNMLVAAEKAGLVAEIGSDDHLFEWMLERYRELMQQKGFEGTPVSVLQRLRANQGDDLELLILRAMHENTPVAGICIACHGTAATYLLGWNGPAGRNLKANQFLLWQAVVHLRQTGRECFDLGGINEDTTPGISAFKLGMNGERYALVGEFLRWQ